MVRLSSKLQYSISVVKEADKLMSFSFSNSAFTFKYGITIFMRASDFQRHIESWDLPDINPINSVIAL